MLELALVAIAAAVSWNCVCTAREEVTTMLTVTASDAPTPYQRLHTRSAGFSESLLPDARLRHLDAP